MSKRKKQKVFITSEGVSIPLKKIPPYLIDRITVSVAFPEPPFYTVETASGNKENHPITQEFIDGPDATEEEKEAWKKYLEENNAAQQKLNEKMLDVFILKGTDLDPSQDVEWMEEQEFFGIKIPEKKHELILHYFKMELLTGPEDIKGLTLAIIENTGRASEDEVAQIRASFRDNLEGQED